jgi:predicted Zn-dependent peptidase
VEVQRTDVGGIPVFSAPAPAEGWAAGGLVFRVGHCDEPLPLRGITHLLEHLAAFSEGWRPYEYSADVGPGQMRFGVDGTPDEVVEWLGLVARRLHDLPLGELGREQRVLLVESLAAGRNVESRLSRLRFGLSTFGLADFGQAVIGRAGAEQLQAWSARFCTRGNVVAWLLGVAPERLELQLPEGPHHPLPGARALPGMRLPAFVAEDDDVVAISVVGRRSPAFGVAWRAACERAGHRLRREQGIVYTLHSGAEMLDLEHALATASARCASVDAPAVRDALLEAVHEVAAAGPTSEEIRRVQHDARFAWRHPAQAMEAMVRVASRCVTRDAPLDDDERLERIGRVTPEEGAAAIAAALDSALMLVPEGVDGPDGFERCDARLVGDRSLGGHRFRRQAGAAARDQPDAVAIGDDGLTVEDPEQTWAVRWEHVAGVEREGGWHLRIHTLAGEERWLCAASLVDADRLLEELGRRLGERLAPATPAVRELEALARRRLERPEQMTLELHALAHALGSADDVPKAIAVQREDGTSRLVAIAGRVLLVARASEEETEVDVWGLDDLTAWRERRGRLRLSFEDGPDLVLAGFDPPGSAAELAALLASRG